MSDVRGLITTIQDYSVHDGYGLRSIVFLKGCALRCGWCQNPESIHKGLELLFRPKLCIMCHQCLETCPQNAIVSNGGAIEIVRSKCNQCMECTKVCPSRALVQVGRWVTPQEVIDAVLPYRTFFDTSDRGGITISGGDPLFQPEFTLELLRACKKNDLHVALETAAYGDPAILEEMMPLVDLWLCDIKHMDDEMHKKGTGVSNKPIKENLIMMSKHPQMTECVVRIPLIHDYNDDKENVTATAKFVKEVLGFKQIDLLPFNYLAASKYKELNQAWKYNNCETQSEEIRQELEKTVAEQGLQVTVGGLW